MKIILGLFVVCASTVAFAGTPHPANCSKIPASATACATICQACAGNFPVGDAKQGNGFYADCSGPIIRNGGAHQPKSAKQPLPPPPSGQTWAQVGQQCTSQGGMPKGL